MSMENNQEAIQRAIEFSQEIGQPVDDVARIEYVVPEIDRLRAYWKPKWEIKFRSRTEIHVDTDGAISQYYYMPIFDYLGETDPTKTPTQDTSGRLLTEADALARANFLFHAIKLPEVFQAEDIKVELSTSPQSQEGERAEWWCSLPRLFNGIRYMRQSSVLTLDARTGELVGSRLNLHTFPPLSSKFVISKDQAIAIASDRLTAVGFERSKCWWMREYVVQPNGRFSEACSFAPSLGATSRVAWVGFFETTDRANIIFVDSETGEILGGDVQFN